MAHSGPVDGFPLSLFSFSSPHNIPQSFLFVLAAKDVVDGFSGEGADLGLVEAEVLRDEAVFVG